MAKFTITFELADEELRSAAKFLKTPDANINDLIKEYFTGKKTLDLSKIPNTHERFYHTNGLCAMVLCIQEAIINQ